MRITALVLGIIGGLGALAASTIAMAVAALALSGDTQSAAPQSWFNAALLGIILSVVAFVGAGLAMTKPRAAAIILLIPTIGLWFTLSGFAIFFSPLLAIASLLAFLGRGPKTTALTTPTLPPSAVQQ
jgi:hypothetical protein